jgi:molybdopterin/thiamine biosynthesis adenylyltransferase
LYQGADSSGLQATVLVVGLGALGSAAATVLDRAGLARLVLVDDDRVELSNLQRQTLFDDGDIGQPKVGSAAQRLAADCTTLETRLDGANAAELFGMADLVIDATDDPAAKWLINRTALATATPYCHAGVVQDRGQVLAVVPGRSACLECAFGSLDEPDGPDSGTNANCADLGILAPVAGLLGSLEALAAVGFLTGDPSFRPGRMLSYELGPRRWRHFDIEPVAGCICDPAQKRSPATGEQATCHS